MCAYDALLKRWVPKRIYAPGTTPAYSNYGASLAGYIVQRISGEPFDAYVEHHIFAPLGMAHSTFRQPLPANLKPLMAEGLSCPARTSRYGYEFVERGAGRQPCRQRRRHGALHDRPPPERRIRAADPAAGDGAADAFARRTCRSRACNGMALGFYQTNINGHRVIAHGGDTVAFHSDLHLFLDENVGIFVSFNSAGKEGAAQPLRTLIVPEFRGPLLPRGSQRVRRWMRPSAKARRAKSSPAFIRPPAARGRTSSRSRT